MAERRFEISRIPGFAIIAVATFVMLYLPIAALVQLALGVDDLGALLPLGLGLLGHRALHILG